MTARRQCSGCGQAVDRFYSAPLLEATASANMPASAADQLQLVDQQCSCGICCLQVCDQVWSAIQSGEAEARPDLLQPLLLLAYCDLKHFKYR